MGSLFIRMLAFCRKELSSSARQPLKVLGLVVGPFIILAIFAAGYTGHNTFNTALVVPNRPDVSTNIADYQSLAQSDAFKLTQVLTDKQAAMNMLHDDQVGVVIVVPDNALDQIYNGQNAEFPVYYRQLNPLSANYIEYSTYVYASEFDKVLLREALGAAKPPSSQIQDYTNQLNASIGRLDTDLKNNQPEQARLEIAQMRALTLIAKDGVASMIVPGTGPNDNNKERNLVSGQIGQGVAASVTSSVSTRITNIDQELDAIDQGVQAKDLTSAQQTNNMNQLRQHVGSLSQDATKLANISPAILVSPVLANAHNESLHPASFVDFYAPAVVILLLQHIGVTLASLSIVRDRMLGAVELFRISPINPTEILIGKFLSYTILLMIVSGLLLAAINVFLGVPMEGDIGTIALILLTSTFASIGLGFLVAGLSKTETQAVQWSMLLLLASIFFTGFIVPLNQFDSSVSYFSYAIPMTFGVNSLQGEMLNNQFPTMFYLLMPVALGVVYFLIGRFLYKRQFSIT